MIAKDGEPWQGEEIITLAKRAGIKTMPWQCGVLLGLSLKTHAGTWVHPTCVMVVPRQNGKSLILSLLILYRIFVLGEKIIYTSHEWKSAEEIATRHWDIIQSRPWLSSRVKKHHHSQGQDLVELKNGGKVYFRTRSAAAGRGADTIDTLIFDEAFDITDSEVAALGPTQSAAKEPQIIYASSAVNREEHAHGMVLSAFREDALSEEPSPSLLYLEWMAPPEMDRDERKTWEYANPSFGVIHSERKISNLMRNMRTPSGQKQFDVEALGRGDWYLTDDGEGDTPLVIEIDQWRALCDPEPEVIGAACIAVDASNEVSNRTWTVAVAVRTQNGIHTQIGFHGQANLKSLAHFIKSAALANDTVAVVIDTKSAASALMPALTEEGIEPQKMTGEKVSAATLAFLQHVDDGTVTHDNDPRIEEALVVARLREIGDGGVAWARRKSEGTICQLVATTNAVYGLDHFDVRVTPPKSLAFVDDGPNIETDLHDTALRW